jgi:hypothetical protein
MADRPQRPTLHLKFAPAPVAKAPSPTAAPAWKCKPCGTGFQVDAALADDEAVRCPSCNARLGLAGEFRQDPPSPKLRARLVGAT